MTTPSRITEQDVEPVSIRPGIAPLDNNQTASMTPTFNFVPTNDFTAGPVEQVMYQVDTWQGAWTSAAMQGWFMFTGTSAPLQPGFHILYAYATDGEETTSLSTGLQNSPLIGNITAYPFVVMPMN